MRAITKTAKNGETTYKIGKYFSTIKQEGNIIFTVNGVNPLARVIWPNMEMAHKGAKESVYQQIELNGVD